MSLIKPRPHQVGLLNDTRRATIVYDRILLTGATGIGKTTLGAMIAEGVGRKGNRAIFSTHKIEILEQLIETFARYNIPHGIIAAGYTESPDEPIQIAMIETLRRRIHKLKYQPQLLVIDEAAHAVCNSWSAVIEAFPGVKVIGLTACPTRGDGKGLGKWFQHLINGPQVGELIELGWLSPFEVWGANPLDLSKVKTKMGEFDADDLEVIMEDPTITGNVLAEYQKHLNGKRALGFGVSIRHSKMLAAAFVDAGIPAAHVDGTTPPAERKMNMAAFRKGTVKVLFNVGLFGEGVDVPLCDGVLDVNPRKSLSDVMQRFGRQARPVFADGMPIDTVEERNAAIAAGPKPISKYIDHAGNILRHGFPDEYHEWLLADKPKKKTKDAAEVAVKQCPMCYYVHRPAPHCPACGSVYEVESRVVKERAGDLVKLERRQTAAVAAHIRKQEQAAARTLGELIALGKKRSYAYPEAWARKMMDLRQSYRGKRRA